MPAPVAGGEWITLALAALGAVVWLVRLEGRAHDAQRRCDELKERLSSLEDVDVRVARIETRLDAVFEQLRDLNASIRWMRQPAGREPARDPNR